MNINEVSQILILFFAAIYSLYGYGTIITRNTVPQWHGYFGLNILVGLILFLGMSGYIELLRLASPTIFHWVIILGICFAVFDLFSNQTIFSKKIV